MEEYPPTVTSAPPTFTSNSKKVILQLLRQKRCKADVVDVIEMEVEELLLAWVAVLVARVDLFVNCHVDLSALEMEMTVYCEDIMP